MDKLKLAKKLLPKSLHNQVTDVFFSFNKSLADKLTYFNPISNNITKNFILDTPMELYDDPYGALSIHIELGGRLTVFDDLEFGTVTALFDDPPSKLDTPHFALNRGLSDEDFIHFFKTQSEYEYFAIGLVSDYFKEINLKKLINYL